MAAAQAMAKHKVSCIVAVKAGQVVGILTNRDFLKKIALGPELNMDSLYSRTVASCMSSPVEYIGPDEPIIEAARIIYQRGIRRLPVLKNGQLVGIITETDLTRALTSCNPINSVGQIMQTDVAVVPPDATIARAAAIMAERRISSVVVVKGDEPIGVVTERDILIKVTTKQLDPTEVTVEQVMTSPLVSIDPSYSVFCAARIMEQMHIHRVLVMEGPRLVGIISQRDVLRATQRLFQAQHETALELFDNSKSPIFILDAAANTIYLNPAFCSLFQLDQPDQLLDRPFLPEQFWQRPEERWQFLEKLKQGDMHIEMLNLKTAKSNPLYVSVACSLIRDIHGQVTGYQGALHDITAKVLAEQASALAYERLEKANQQLKQIQSQIVQTERLASIGQLAAGVAHEMNTPVGFVASNFEALQKYVNCLRQLVMQYEELIKLLNPAKYPELAERLAQIDSLKAKMKIGFILEDIQSLFDESKEGLERVTAIIKNLRDLSRTDQADKWDSYNINAGVEATLVVARNELKYDTEVVKELGDVPEIPAHANQINQVLLNIIV
ncbi:MAG: CBS domain-containing protein, partial [Sedimentisphaerales bacterium]|nr:CBS domain-containing protein [Sedimentisphaerales bacterium]